ncbi:MAG: hypothetical protein WAM42_18945 [Candidatus Nitrosopolaris sp.]
MKAWDPPEENLYPVLNDLLDDWMPHLDHRLKVFVWVLGGRLGSKWYCISMAGR